MHEKEIMGLSGLDFFKRVRDSNSAGMSELMDMKVADLEEGYASLEAMPSAKHFNPLGIIHGGFTLTLLDSVMGAAIMTSLGPGKAFNTLETKVNFVRPLSADTGLVRAEGRAIYVGSRVGTAEGKLFDETGKLYAHGTSTVLIVDVV